jgi:hypothetical protein
LRFAELWHGGFIWMMINKALLNCKSGIEINTLLPNKIDIFKMVGFIFGWLKLVWHFNLHVVVHLLLFSCTNSFPGIFLRCMIWVDFVLTTYLKFRGPN